ncbi:uncharacterized protein STEHIDRAFT_162847 [Stereum hirsutum FP-91666 SS1]|uniref:Uncharacterized protein n=1 Tax=Stereum hirsutum (strain FP-91666) TaxID=721885 RepID=R7RYE7_STEHR|nr:uncharacterized protein STEHIDRAFT_162847 [Stereum hirsutum FP-91666 SS1]EIM80431.1 hypothetical protein STEHIDRAFT_162847 [Stereum hirsutum FP-91666 SS1]
MLVAQLQAVFPELYSTFYNGRRGSVALVGSESQTQHHDQGSHHASACAYLCSDRGLNDPGKSLSYLPLKIYTSANYV